MNKRKFGDSLGNDQRWIRNFIQQKKLVHSKRFREKFEQDIDRLALENTMDDFFGICLEPDWEWSAYCVIRSRELEEGRRQPISFSCPENISAEYCALVNWLVRETMKPENIFITYRIFYCTVAICGMCVSAHVGSSSSSDAGHARRMLVIGVTCLFIAFKYIDINYSTDEIFRRLAQYQVGKEEILTLEKTIRECLASNKCTPTIFSCHCHLLAGAEDYWGEDRDTDTVRLNLFLMELSLMDKGCRCFSPSLVAASVLLLSNAIKRPQSQPWSLEFQLFSGYKLIELKECVFTLRKILEKERAAMSIVGMKHASVRGLNVPSQSDLEKIFRGV